MSRWDTVTLTSHSWEISRWLSEPVWGAVPSDYSGATVRLGDVATLVPTREQLSNQRIVVSPDGIDCTSGAITKTKLGTRSRGCSLKEDLELGDVLVPQYGRSPCVFVTDEHANLAFSHFVPIRARDAELSASLLWAILTCATGIRARDWEKQGATRLQLRPADLLEVHVPRLPADEVLRTEIGLLLPSPAVDLASPPVRPSDWESLTLHPNDWWRPVTMVGVLVETGPRLGDVADLVAGRAPRGNPTALEFPNSVPLADARWVRAGQPTRWYTRDDMVVVEDGAVVLSTEGRFHARVVQGSVGLGRSVVAIKPRAGPESISSAALAAHLNTDAAQIVLAQLAKGGTLPRLKQEDLFNLRLPTQSRLQTLDQSPAVEAIPITDLLESALWNS